MTTRNRTPLFLSFRQSMRKRSVSMEGGESGGSRVSADGQTLLNNTPADIEMPSVNYDMPPAWVDTVEQTEQCIKRITTRLNDLKEAHGKHLLVGFDDMDDTEQEVEVLTSELSRLFKTCESKIRFLTTTQKESTGTKNDQVVKNLQSHLAVELSGLYSQFRKMQKQYLSKLRGQEQIASDFVQVEEDDDDYGLMGFTSDQARLVTLNDEMLRERDAEIAKITQSIEDLAVLFKDLQTLVIDQGTILDRIDYNIEQTQVHVEEAVGQLKKAEKSQKQSKTMLCIYFLLVACGALAMVLIIKKST
eukprot:c3805_g1_i1.p1 GENE.c3805_g1_i1~~c3805_g1_i1.p1  ORF type:complete len:316 (-),score=74.07 c3805_g1_i1:44-955(-)